MDNKTKIIIIEKLIKVREDLEQVDNMVKKTEVESVSDMTEIETMLKTLSDIKDATKEIKDAQKERTEKKEKEEKKLTLKQYDEIHNKLLNIVNKHFDELVKLKHELDDYSPNGNPCYLDHLIELYVGGLLTRLNAEDYHETDN